MAGRFDGERAGPRCRLTLNVGRKGAAHSAEAVMPPDFRNRRNALRLSALQRLSPAGGVTITGIALSQKLSPDKKDAIVEAFLAHHIVVFPGQSLTREQQFAFAANFGEVEAHGAHRGENKRYGVAHVMSNLGADGNPTIRVSRAANYHWHTDKPYHPAPPLLTTLYAVEVPPAGGDTEFANTALAYVALPEETKRRIAGLRVVFRPA